MMTPDAKKALAKAIRGLRAALIDQLGEALEQRYKLSIADAARATLDAAARVDRVRLEAHLDEGTRALPTKERPAARARLQGELVKDAAATFVQRLVYLRLLEAAGLRPVQVVAGSTSARGYLDFRAVAPALVGDDTEGYAVLLRLVFDDLAHDLPGLYGPVRLTALVPLPPKAWKAVLDVVNDPDLDSVWTDDTALGWIYQYWNDPEREALDAKLAARAKLENHELASKTQMFTERYMVEWLLHNSLGQQWLAMCERHGWVADARRTGVLDALEARRADWRARRDAGEVALDALMPIADGLEDRWKYWVPQPLPADAVTSAPASVRDLKVLDPACGSGHFLVIAMDLLFALYQEEARHRGVAGQDGWTDRDVIEAILERNLFGIDIDPRAVQIAAAALLLKARGLCRDAMPRTMNLVAPALGLAALPKDDPARVELLTAVEAETALPQSLTARVLDALAGADHLGTLLRVEDAVREAVAEWDGKLASTAPEQGSLWGGFGAPRVRPVSAETARSVVLERLAQFLDRHSTSADLGLRLHGEQLAAGVRFLRMVKEGQYDLVVGNPPYQGTSKMADKAYVEKHYPRGKADLYAAFLERGLQLAKDGGVSAMLTMRNWMFLTQYTALRTWLIETWDLRVIGDVDRGAFEEVPDEVVSAVMSIFRRAAATSVESIAVLPTPFEDKARDGARTQRKRAALRAQAIRHQFCSMDMSAIQGSPVIYWWPVEHRRRIASLPTLAGVAPPHKGMTTSDNTRFLRRPHELAHAQDSMDIWAPYILGAKGLAWLAPHTTVLHWAPHGLEVKVYNDFLYGSYSRSIQNEAVYFRPGVAFSTAGNDFSGRLHTRASVIDSMGSSVYGHDLDYLACLLNSSASKQLMTDLNPTFHFKNADVMRLPLLPISGCSDLIAVLRNRFQPHEAAREPSVEFKHPGPSPWRHAQDWAQLAVDRPEGAPLPPYEPIYDPEPPTDHLSFALGVALGRFGAAGEGILTTAPADALPHGILFLSAASDRDSLAHPAARPIVDAWAAHGDTIDPARSLSDFLRDRFFADVHKPMYENRPIYFPLSSARRSFVAYVSIHRWTADTLRALQAEHLTVARRDLEAELADLRVTRTSADRKAARAADKRASTVAAWLDELDTFLATLVQCAERRPPRPDDKTPDTEVDARYLPDLDDGVMINAAALWPLLDPQWKDPKKWWKELASATGKKDYDWSHLAARYFPARVDTKCRLDPSLAVAHTCFWRYHPARAYAWELRLQDELRPDFLLSEPDAPTHRTAFLASRADEAAALLAKEHTRRARKAKDADQPDLPLADPDDADDEQA